MSTSTRSRPTKEERTAERMRMLRRFENPIMIDAMAEITDVAGYELLPEERQPFSSFINWVNKRPAFISEWRSNPETERSKYLRFMTVTSDVSGAYAAASYHFDNLREVESEVRAILSRMDLNKAVPPNVTLAFRRIEVIDFEYQAFVLAYRRCLDYFAWGISTYFSMPVSSYRRLGKSLNGAAPVQVSAPILDVYKRHQKNFAFVMADERGASVRDLITHKRHVDAGTINLRSTGFQIIGGGENMDPANWHLQKPVMETTADKLKNLHSCLADLLACFQTSVINYEATLA